MTDSGAAAGILLIVVGLWLTLMTIVGGLVDKIIGAKTQTATTSQYLTGTSQVQTT